MDTTVVFDKHRCEEIVEDVRVNPKIFVAFAKQFLDQKEWPPERIERVMRAWGIDPNSDGESASDRPSSDWEEYSDPEVLY